VSPQAKRIDHVVKKEMPVEKGHVVQNTAYVSITMLPKSIMMSAFWEIIDVSPIVFHHKLKKYFAYFKRSTSINSIFINSSKKYIFNNNNNNHKRNHKEKKT